MQKRALNKQTNRALIIAAAQQCFLEQGFDAVAIRDIIRNTPLAPGTFYNYFDSKETLLKTILEEQMVIVDNRMHEVRLAATSLHSFIYEAYLSLFISVVENPLFFKLILRNEHTVRKLFNEAVLGLPMRSLAEDLRRGVDLGWLAEPDLPWLTASLYGIGYEIGRVLINKDHQRTDAEAAARYAADLVLKGAATKNPAI